MLISFLFNSQMISFTQRIEDVCSTPCMFMHFFCSILRKPVEQKLPGTCTPEDLTRVDLEGGTGREAFETKLPVLKVTFLQSERCMVIYWR